METTIGINSIILGFMSAAEVRSNREQPMNEAVTMRASLDIGVPNPKP